MENIKKLIRKYNKPCPRYTSYPAVPHWIKAPSEDVWIDHLNDISFTNNEADLYVHVPFCESLCYYCGCHRTMTKSHDGETEFINLIKKEIIELIKIINEKKISLKNCYFLTPSFEMEVKTKRNVTRKNITNTERIRDIIADTILNQCQHIDGLEIMKASAYFDGKERLRRVLIQGRAGCGGAAENDNIHLCGEVAKDLAQKVCSLLND